jgi:hypothetical protein
MLALINAQLMLTPTGASDPRQSRLAGVLELMSAIGIPPLRVRSENPPARSVAAIVNWKAGPLIMTCHRG